MFKSRWIIAFAFGISISASVQAQQQAQGSEDAPTAKRQPTEPYSISIHVRIIEDSVAAEARKRSERQREEREKNDLIAQERMADATEAMNEATQSMKRAAWWSFGAVAFGTVFLLYTLMLTRRTARSAEAAVNVTRKIGEAQTRAYLGFDMESGRVEEGQPLMFRVKITNYGISPAFEIAVASVAIVRGADWTWENVRERDLGVPPSGYLHPNGSIRAVVGSEPPMPLTADQIVAIRSERAVVFARVTVFFKDVFSDETDDFRTAEFRFEFSGEECFRSGTARIARTGNDST